MKTQIIDYTISKSVIYYHTNYVSLTTSQRQQRLSNVLLAGNLYKAHKIGKQLTQITALHKMSLGVSIANLKVNAQVLSSIRSLNQKMDQQEAEKRKIKLLKDIFFQITEEIEEIEGEKLIH